MHDTRGQIHNFTLTGFAFVLQIIFELLHFWLVAPAKQDVIQVALGTALRGNLPEVLECWNIPVPAS